MLVVYFMFMLEYFYELFLSYVCSISIYMISVHSNSFYFPHEGMVGIVDKSLKVTQFAKFHQKSVYRVEWAPRILPSSRLYTGSKETPSLLVYTCGAHVIQIYFPNEPAREPIKLGDLNPGVPNQITDFCFSPDHEYMVIGAMDGVIYVYRCALYYGYISICHIYS